MPQRPAERSPLPSWLHGGHAADVCPPAAVDQPGGAQARGPGRLPTTTAAAPGSFRRPPGAARARASGPGRCRPPRPRRRAGSSTARQTQREHGHAGRREPGMPAPRLHWAGGALRGCAGLDGQGVAASRGAGHAAGRPGAWPARSAVISAAMRATRRRDSPNRSAWPAGTAARLPRGMPGRPSSRPPRHRPARPGRSQGHEHENEHGTGASGPGRCRPPRRAARARASGPGRCRPVPRRPPGARARGPAAGPAGPPGAQRRAAPRRPPGPRARARARGQRAGPMPAGSSTAARRSASTCTARARARADHHGAQHHHARGAGQLLDGRAGADRARTAPTTAAAPGPRARARASSRVGADYHARGSGLVPRRAARPTSTSQRQFTAASPVHHGRSAGQFSRRVDRQIHENAPQAGRRFRVLRERF